MEITKNTVISELLELGDEGADILFSIGMHCVGCPSAQNETIGEACEVHGADIDAVLAKLNACASAKN